MIILLTSNTSMGTTRQNRFGKEMNVPHDPLSRYKEGQGKNVYKFDSKHCCCSCGYLVYHIFSYVCLFLCLWYVLFPIPTLYLLPFLLLSALYQGLLCSPRVFGFFFLVCDLICERRLKVVGYTG